MVEGRAERPTRRAGTHKREGGRAGINRARARALREFETPHCILAWPHQGASLATPLVLAVSGRRRGYTQ